MCINREEHAIRAVDAVLGVSELLVFGSEAVPDSISGDLPIEVARSVEFDVTVLGDIDGYLADLSYPRLPELTTISACPTFLGHANRSVANV